MYNTEKVWKHSDMFPETRDTVPGDVGNCLHTVVTITQTVMKNAIHNNGWTEGRKKKEKKERGNENDIKIHVTKMNN